MGFTRNTISLCQCCVQQKAITKMETLDLTVLYKVCVHLYSRCCENQEMKQAHTFSKHQMELLSKPQSLNYEGFICQH